MIKKIILFLSNLFQKKHTPIKTYQGNVCGNCNHYHNGECCHPKVYKEAKSDNPVADSYNARIGKKTPKYGVKKLPTMKCSMGIGAFTPKEQK